MDFDDIDSREFEGAGYVEQDQHTDYESKSEHTIKNPGEKASNLLPVTIKQILEAKQNDDDTYVIDNTEFEMVTFVGKITSVKPTSTNMLYIIDDGTGKIEVKIWINDKSYNATKKDEWTYNTYVRVYGHVRRWEGKTSVMSFRLKKIENFNEITHHFLEAINVHLYNTRDGKSKLGGYGQKSAQRFKQEEFVDDIAPDNKIDHSGFNPLQYKIMQLVQNAGNDPNIDPETGISFQQITDVLTEYSSDEIGTAIHQLYEEGHLYSTVENHFKSTNSD